MSKELRELANVYYGQSPAAVIDQDGLIPVLGTGGVYGKANKSLYNGPAIVVPRKGSLGNPQLVEQPFWPVDTTYAVIPKAGVDAAWLFCNLDLFDLTRLNEATGVPSINRDWLYRIAFHDPGPIAQRKIGTIFRSIDRSITSADALIKKYQWIKVGLMHELFIRGLDRNGQLRPPQHAAPELYKDSQIGWIPKSWKLVPIQQISALIVDCPHSTPVLDDDGYLMARTSEIKDGMLLSAQSPRVSEPEFRKRNLRAKPTPGDIVFTREAPVGENFVIPIGLEICLGQRMMLIRPESTICNSAFLSHYLYTGQVVRRFHRITGGTTNPHLNVADVKMFPVVVPDIEEQHSISDRLAAIDEELRTVSKSRLKLQFQKLGALHDLLSEDFPWKLIKETDEPAYV